MARLDFELNQYSHRRVILSLCKLIVSTAAWRRLRSASDYQLCKRFIALQSRR